MREESHAIINITYGIKVESEENPYKRVMSKANFKAIRDEMNKVDSLTVTMIWNTGETGDIYC